MAAKGPPRPLALLARVERKRSGATLAAYKCADDHRPIQHNPTNAREVDCLVALAQSVDDQTAHTWGTVITIVKTERMGRTFSSPLVGVCCDTGSVAI